jgi:hypothetical protein
MKGEIRMKWRNKCQAQLLPMALTGLILAAPASAADTAAQKREKELLQRLAESDAQTATLKQRVDRLENHVEALKGALAGAASAKPAMTQASMMAQAAPASPAAPRAPSDAARPAASRSAPGTFEVDEEAAQRALERTLTQSGALLLPMRTVELTPSLTYRRTEQSIPVLATVTIPATSSSALVLANQRNRQNEFIGNLDFRAGLPYSTQVELSLPFTHVKRTQVTDLSTTTSNSGNGIGDIRLGAAKTLTRESGWKPDLIGRLSYNFGNGKRQAGDVELGGGFRQVQGELVALKRQDPLAFVASIFYQKTFEKDAIKPGDAAGFSLTALLAASPATSLQLGVSQIYRKKQEFNGVTIPGSDQTYAIASLGASSVLSRDLTLVTQLGIGLGNDAPKYSLTVALPILFR